MNNPSLTIGRVERRLSSGNTEELIFKLGVNLLVGEPGTGKTKWLQTIDYLLGDDGDNPFEGTLETGLAEKYEAAAAELIIGKEKIWIERRWRERGAKGKVFVNGDAYGAREFQLLLMEKLGIPALSFPKGNPMSGQTWPLLSFRMLLRHIYRRQIFWGDIADKQPDGEQHACILQFLGLAERLFTDDYGKLIGLKLEVERRKAQRSQYGETLNELVSDVVSDDAFKAQVNPTSVRQANDKISKEIDELHKKRKALISSTLHDEFPTDIRNGIEKVAENRAKKLITLEEHKIKSKITAERIEEMSTYHRSLSDELMRLKRADEAGAVFSDLKITHCPACDQTVKKSNTPRDDCFLCHQKLPDEPLVEGLGAVRLQFEQDRLKGEVKEAAELLTILKNEAKKLNTKIREGSETVQMLDNELKPARQAVAGLIQEQVSSIDMALGAQNERQRQVSRIATALEFGQELTKKISDLERQIIPLKESVDEAARATDFAIAAAYLEEGMNAYFEEINKHKPETWKHSPVSFEVNRNSYIIRIGHRRWRAALGGTDTLFFLMAYHYGLMTLYGKTEFHYPGMGIIDVPGDFLGVAVEDKENFIVQPFIDLLASDGYEDVQFIITGASFSGLEDVNRNHLTQVHTS